MLSRDLPVSDWMYQHIRQEDVELQRSFQGILSHQSSCWEKYRDFLCSVIGQCVDARVLLVNTREMCQAILDW